MENHIEQYQARQGGVTLHTWTESAGMETGELLHYRGVRNADSRMVP